MVLPKRSDYVSCGYQVPPMPYWPRSAKGKRSIRKKIEHNQMCPFDLLATVAGKLLAEGEYSILSPHSSSGISNFANIAKVKKETLSVEEILKTEACDEQSCNDNGLAPLTVTKGHITFDLKEYSKASRPAGSGHFFLGKSDISDAIARKSCIFNNMVKIGCPGNAAAHECGTRRKNCSTFANVQLDGMAKLQEPEAQFPRDGLEFDSLRIYRLHVPVHLDAKPPVLLNFERSAEVPEYNNCVPLVSSLPKHEDGLDHIVDRDDDENSSGCTHPSNVTNMAIRPRCIGNHGARKLSSLNYWKASPNVLYHETKLGFCRKKICYTHQRKQKSFKSRKLLKHQSSTSSSERLFSEEEISDLCEKIGNHGQACSPHLPVHTTIVGANGESSAKLGQSSSYNSVKLRIKSFKVPQLFVEIPETATVGSLKRTVLEAVTAIVQGGLRVGVLLQGKKVRDDHKTLREAGISQGYNLGFALEPSHTHSTQTVTSPGDTVEKPASIIAPVAHSSHQDTYDAIPQPALTSCPESSRDSSQSPTDILPLDRIRGNPRAPPGNVKELAVPLHKPRCPPEHVQRRIRRPFSVAEVEALIQAVEKLGTGRWRDIKFWAFDNAKHRTYVDLKDKWKTLVHTARISPQQRRGEPVPQELLGRVLSAQAYWSQQQAKLRHGKPPATEITMQ